MPGEIAPPVELDPVEAMLLASLRLHGVSAERDGIAALLVHARRNFDAYVLLHANELPQECEPASVFRP